ncbi:MAG: hypothetical protein IKC32_05805 [Clostridia bacterium]|nr:hypothetical protein [Clostridia bacterium]
MKIAKRVLVGLLAFAVLVSGLLVSSFAIDVLDDGAAGGQLPDYADVLKYYDPAYSRLYDLEDFEDGAYEADILLMDAARPYTDVKVMGVGSDAYLAITLGHILNPDAKTDAAYSVSLDGDALANVVINASIAAVDTGISGKVCPKCSNTYDNVNKSLCTKCGAELASVSSKVPTVGVYVTETDKIGVALIKFDYVNGVVSYYNGSAYSIIDGFVPAAEKWYDVSVVYDATQYSFSITDGERTYTAEAVNSPVYTVKGVSIGTGYADDGRGGMMMIDDVFVQAGVDNRNKGVDLAAVTENGLAVINSLVQDADVDVEIKNDVIAVYDELVGKYAAELAVSEAITALHTEIKANMLSFFSAQLKVAVDAIDTSASYSNRLTHVEDNAAYATRIAELSTDGVSEEDAAVIELYNLEKAALAALEAASLEFIDYINGVSADSAYVFSSEDYEELKAFVDATSAKFDVDGVPTYSATYPTIGETYSLYLTAYNRYSNGLAASKIFCENVAIAAAVEANFDAATDEEFAAALGAYEIAAELGFTNETYPGMEDAILTFDSLVKIEAISLVAEQFIDSVSTADKAIYLFKKEEWLDKCAPDYDTVDVRYPGVSDAKALYDSIRKQIQDTKDAAAEYIAAVADIEGKTGDALIAAIEKALALKENGNVPGIEGVSEANIALDNAYNASQLKLAYANKFITLVAAIEEADTIEERFAAINAAEGAQGNADDTVAGVSEAKIAYVKAVGAYNSEIAAINASYDDVASVAANVSGGATVLSDIIKLVVSSIQKVIG